VLIGKPLDFTLRFGEALSPSCKWIVIDPDPAIVARAEKALEHRLLLSEIACAQASVKMLAEKKSIRSGSAWRQRVREALAYEPPQWTSDRATSSERVHPVEMCSAIRSFLEKHEGATLVSDGGE